MPTVMHYRLPIGQFVKNYVQLRRSARALKFRSRHMAQAVGLMRCLHDPANVQQTSSKCIQNTRTNAGRLLDHVNTL